MVKFSAIFLVLAAQFPASFAQVSEKNVEMQTPDAGYKSILSLLSKPEIRQNLQSEAAFSNMLAKPTGGRFELTPPATAKLTPRQIYEKAKSSLMRVGWYYLCKSCNDWHLNMSGAYAISADGLVATCHHCVKPSDDMKTGFFVCLNSDGTLAPVQSVVYQNETLDLAILKVDSKKLSPLGLAVDCVPGDAAYIFSNPLQVNGYFSDGIVNRYFWNDDKAGSLKTLSGVENLRVNVSTDWAPGSSGAPVLNDFGNVIGHVSTISPQAAGRQTMFYTHEAVPALGIKLAVGK